MSSTLVKILMVDDEPKNLTALETVLAAEDRVLVQAGSGPDALKELLQDDFAVILLDVHMPDMDGFETAELIRGRERSRETPIIFLTAAISGDVSIARGYSLGAVDYLIKPLDPEILKSKVAVFIELFRKTEQVKHQASELAEASAFLNSVLEGVTEYAIMALDLEGTIIGWNEGARRVFGYTHDEVAGRTGLAVLLRDDEREAAWLGAVLETARGDGRAVRELSGVAKGERRFPCRVTVEQRLGGGEVAVGYVAIAQDITALREAEQQRTQFIQEQVARGEAERARDRLRQVVDVLPEGILLADADGRIVLCNAAALAIIRVAPPESDRWGYETIDRYRLDGTPCPLEELPLVRSVRGGEVVRGEQLLVGNAGSGELVPVLQNSAPLRDPEGRIVGGVMAFQDISPIKEFERQKDSFLAAASHDLKNPLAVVKAQAQLLMRRARRFDHPDATELIEGLRGIDQATKRLAGMVNELLDVARLQMGRPVELDPMPMDLAELVRQVVADLQPSSDLHQIRVNSSWPSVLGTWDRERLERVLVNLITNAIKYSPDGGTITLQLDQEEEGENEWAVLRVRDGGIGIPRGELAHIFERFYRASNVAGRIEGAGIGLSGVRQIVEQHGGTVAVDSKVGRGSTFVVRLPCVPARVEVP